MEASGTNAAPGDAARIELGGATDVGRRREHNEDAWTIFGAGPDDTWKVAIVADGMGGHNAGEVASSIAIVEIERELATGSGPDAAWGGDDTATLVGVTIPDVTIPDAPVPDVPVPDEADAEEPADPNAVTSPGMILAPIKHTDPSRGLTAAIERANRAIWEEAQRDPSRAGMGTTVVGAVFVGTRAYLANVGDSPAVLVRGGESRQITRDHGWVAEQVEAGLIDPEDAPHHPYRNILTRCLGTERSVAVEAYEPLELLAGDLLVLCSDGVTTHVEVGEIAEVVSRATPTAAARLLISLANDRGGLDNITVIVARVVGA